MEQLINFIIRPPRAEYNPKNDLLDQEFLLKNKWYQRKDLEVREYKHVILYLCIDAMPPSVKSIEVRSAATVIYHSFLDVVRPKVREMDSHGVKNSRGDVLQCSHYMPVVPPEGKTLPCVIYCHGNSGCRTDASEAAVILLPSNITVFTLDFSGSGLSGGEHVTLGWNEKDDLRAVVDYLRADGNVSLIGLWGRSMGAVTSLMYGAEDPSIAGMVLDSPFSDLVDLMMELVDTYKVRLPKFTVKFAIQYMRKAIQRKAKFDISELNTIKVAKSCFVPVLFGHGIEDDFIQPHHSDRVFDAYVGDKNIIKFEGDHNSPRPQFYFDSISIFFNNVLQPPEDEGGSRYFDLTNDYFNRGRWSSVQDVDLSDEILGTPSGPPASSTEDAIRQLRSRRPMSATVVPAEISSNDNQPDSVVESRGSDAQPSTSNMISLEFARDSPHGSLGPGSVDDDEYVEYSLDMLADFPNNVEEEERMLMVAILESLKDSEGKPPPVEEPSSGIDGSSLPKPEPAPNNKAGGEILLPEIPPKYPQSSEADASRTYSPPSDTSKCNHNLSNADTITTTVKKPTINVAVARPREGETSRSTSRTETVVPSDNHRASDADMADRTKVTVEVEKNPTTNIIDGLLRRWDIFRNR